MMPAKIKPEHRSRCALVYIRQSSSQQVKNNLESQQRQYHLENRAQDWGFAEIEIIDEDLGISASGLYERPGFQRIMDLTVNGKVGIIMGLEVSRMARNGREWHTLLECCRYSKTLIAENETVYSLEDANDCMVLDFKGSMSEMELRILRNRLVEGALNKAKRGKLITLLPAGYVRTNEDRIEPDPDERVRQAIESIFTKFEQTGSIRQIYIYFTAQEIPLPIVSYGKFGRELLWKPASYDYLRSMLKNPIYAGCYAYGRRKSSPEMREGRPVIVSRLRKDSREWDVRILGNHPGYISWETYENNQRRIASNQQKSGKGAALKGKSLLTGLLRCRRCGRSLSVHYRGNQGASVHYACYGIRGEPGTTRCLGLSGRLLDEGVAHEVLCAISPLGIEAAIEAEQEISRQIKAQNRHLEMGLEDAKYQAERAWRQYNGVDPENRLVASSLERRWNEKLDDVEALTHKLADFPVAKPLDEQERQDLQRLGKNLSALWKADSTTPEIRKQIVRSVLEEIVVDTTDEPAKILAWLHWKGGVHTFLELERMGTRPASKANGDVVKLVGMLTRQMEDRDIVAILNKLGYKTGKGNNWTEMRLRAFRSSRKIPSFNPKEAGKYLNLSQAAQSLGLTSRQTKILLDHGILKGQQIVPQAPWSIMSEDLDTDEVKQAVVDLKGNRKFPQTRNQLSLFE